MLNLFLRSIMVLALLFGLLFAIGMVVIFYFELPIGFAVVFAIGIVLLQYLLGPWILELIYKIKWTDMRSNDGHFRSKIRPGPGTRRSCIWDDYGSDHGWGDEMGPLESVGGIFRVGLLPSTSSKANSLPRAPG